MSCEHRGCQCEEALVDRGGKKYCSENCAERESSGRHVSRCDCGHPSCGAA
jgi:hypothetical protein